jgi:glycosyltransferase XagB
MGIGIRGAAAAASREICSQSVGSSFQVREQKSSRQEAVAAVLDAAERRAAALDESIDHILTNAGVRAAEYFKLTWPKLSAATLNPLTNVIPLLLGMSAFATMLKMPSMIALSILAVMPAAFRIWIVAHSRADSADPIPGHLPTTPVEDLPVYSIIVPLRSEARVVDQLLSAIERLDYPAEKLDVILAVEADDHETRAAITSRKHRIPIVVIPVPPTEPRTKPKALNVALPFARGTFTVIYDAEDRPERNQLRRAFRAFCSEGYDLACLQARLCMDTRTSWLARYFTAEYAGHFDIFLPRLAALGLPLPLGGSSNHFRTEVLRQVGGWDAHNVTEDADLGMRLARFGYRSGVIDSTTYEEAPSDLRRWFGQRTRWFKGWMQTWLVHMREPRQLFRELGFAGFLTFQLIVGGNALVALAHSVFMVVLIFKLVALVLQSYDWALVIHMVHCLGITAVGYSISAYFGWLGLGRRGERKKFRILIWTPVHWLLLSFAAWSATFELITRPYFWKKTEHGLDQASRQESRTRSLLELERHLTELEKNGLLPRVWALEIAP